MSAAMFPGLDRCELAVKVFASVIVHVVLMMFFNINVRSLIQDSDAFFCVGCLWYGRVVCDGNVVKVSEKNSARVSTDATQLANLPTKN